MEEAEAIVFAAIGLVLVVVIVVSDRADRKIRYGLPGTWRYRWGGQLTTTWNGHPVVADFATAGGESQQEWAIVEIAVRAPARLLVKRRGVFKARLGGPPIVTLNEPTGELEVRSDDPAFAQRLFADPVMARTLPLTLNKPGEEILISNAAVRVRRFAVDGSRKDAVQSAWFMATGVVTALGLASPSARSEGSS
jgi:hypothetical protein